MYVDARRYREGFDFRGRSKILSISCRNTLQIVGFSWDFYRTHLSFKDRVKEDSSIEDVESIIKQCANFNEEASWVARAIRKLHDDKKVPYAEIAILYHVRSPYSYSYVDRLSKELDRLEVPYDCAADTVKLSTLESSKGLDFQAVFIVNVESMPFKLEENMELEVSLF